MEPDKVDRPALAAEGLHLLDDDAAVRGGGGYSVEDDAPVDLQGLLALFHEPVEGEIDVPLV